MNNIVNPVDDLFLKTMCGSSLALLSENVVILNKVANDLYEKKELNESEVDTLRKIIMICNVLYNRSDREVLPIEDGFYDLLLEKYKVYDQHFQVGSAVVNIQNDIESNLTPDSQYKPVISPIRFFEVEEKDELHQQIYDDLSRISLTSREDFAINPISFLQEDITKRQHDTSHNHPDLVGTLDKTKFIFNQDAIDAGAFNDPNVKILERDFFAAHIKKGIIDPNDKLAIVCELKYDGISVEADCSNTLESARTRGDTGIGEAADITPILYGYPFKHAKAMIGEKPIGVKFEAIMTKDNLYRFNQLRDKSYSNCRTAIVGLFGASDAHQFRDLITLVPLAVDRNNVPQLSNRMEEIEFLNRLFRSEEPLKYCYFEGNVSELLFLIKAFYDEAFALRDRLNFMYDGIVVSYVDEELRSTLGRSNFINKYSVAVKFDPLEKITTFRGYTYEVGQNGVITPMIHYDTVEFMGTLHNKSTGSSLSRFNDLALKEGDLIKVTYVNDVMPYVSRLECSHNRDNPNPPIKIIDQCPVCGSKLVVSPTGKTIMCPNMDCDGRSIQRMVNMFQKLNIKGFAEATFKILNVHHLWQLAEMTEDFLVKELGDVDGKSFYQIIQSLRTNHWYDYMVMGALGFSSIARKKWKSILEKWSVIELYHIFKEEYSDFRLYTILMENMGDVTARVICDEYKFFLPDIEFIVYNMHLIDTKGSKRDPSKNITIRFSGCRNLQLTQQLSTRGIDIDDGSVTKSTDILLVPYKGYASGKVSKAKKYGTRIIAESDFVNNLEEILNQIIEVKSRRKQ